MCGRRTHVYPSAAPRKGQYIHASHQGMGKKDKQEQLLFQCFLSGRSWVLGETRLEQAKSSQGESLAAAGSTWH